MSPDGIPLGRVASRQSARLSSTNGQSDNHLLGLFVRCLWSASALNANGMAEFSYRCCAVCLLQPVTALPLLVITCVLINARGNDDDKWLSMTLLRAERGRISSAECVLLISKPLHHTAGPDNLGQPVAQSSCSCTVPGAILPVQWKRRPTTLQGVGVYR